MSKKFLILVLAGVFTLALMGCSNGNKNKSNDKNIAKSEKNLNLTEKDIQNIQESLKTFTDGTAFDNATFKIEQDQNKLKVSVIKPITDIMTKYKTATSDDTVKAIKKSLTFDEAYDSIKNEIKKDFECMQIFIFNGEKEFKNNDYYTLKTIM